MRNWVRRALACVVCSVLAVSLVWAERVSEDDAALVANHFMNVASSSSQGHKAPAKRMVLKKAPSATEESQYYVYQNEDGEGWVIVAANDVVRPILAYSNTGTFRTDNQPSNLKVWLNGYNRLIKRAETDGLVANEETQQEWAALRKGAKIKKATAVVSPLIKTGWDQDSPYWNLCPQKSGTRCLTGCVATAMAQVMNYWQWPKQGTGSHTIKKTSYSANFGETTYDWANMKNTYSGSETSAQKTAVATLMYHCGVAVDMSYNTSANGGSGAYTIDFNGYFSGQGTMCAEKALTTFFGYNSETVKGYYRDGDSGTGMKSWKKADWIAMLKAELDAARPIMYAGAGKENGQTYGHSFVCDGYDSDDMFHFNFGWSNSCDGYYDVDILNTDVPGNGGGNGYYSLEQDVIIGIEPPVTGHAVVTNGTGCTITPSANFATNDEAFTATIEPTDASYDFTSITVKLGSTILSKTTHYTLSNDNKTLTIKASAITGDNSNDLTITAVWTKNRYLYNLLGENCTPEEAEGVLEKNAALNLTILPASGYTLNDADCWEVMMGENTLTYGTGFTYNASNGAFAIAKVTGDVVIFVYGGKQVTWIANNTTFATTLTSSDKYVLPTATPEIECDGKVFVGWCATENYSSATTAPDFVKDGDAANKGMIFYAVFATKGEGGGSETTEKASSIAVGDEVILVYEEGSKELSGIGGSSTKYGEGVDYTTTPEGAYLLEVVAGSTGGTFALKHGSDYLQWASGNSLNTKTSIDENSSWTITFSSGNAIIKNAADATRSLQWNSGSPRFACYTTAQKAVQLYKAAGGGESYSDYTTSCTPPCVGELTGITLNTNDVKKAFTEGEAFSYEGLVVTANYDGCDSKIVVPTSVSTPDMNIAGKQTVTVTFEGKTATYEITIAALPTYTIRFYNNGALVGTAQSVKQGQQPNMPATPSACEGYTFVGWLSTVLAKDVTEKPSYVTNFTVTQNQDYFAAYSYTEEGEGGGEPTIEKATSIAVGDEVILVYEKGKMELSGFTTSGTLYGQGTSYTTLPSGSYSFKVVAGSATGSFAFERDGIYWNYSGGSNSFSTADEISAYSSWTVSISGGDATIQNVNSSTRTIRWNNSSPRFACYTSGQESVQLYKKISSGSSSTTYYTTSPSCEACTAAVTVSKGTESHGSFSLDNSGELSTCDGAVTVTVKNINPAEGYRFKEITQSGIESAVIDQTAKTVTYAKKSEGASTISVIFEALPKYTVRFFANGVTLSTQNVIAGEKAETPNNPSAPCDGYEFVGWWTEALAMDNTTAQEWITDFTVTQAQDYYAIFSKTVEEAGAGESEVASVTFKTAGSDKTQESSDIAADIVDSDSGIAEYNGTKVFAGVNGAKLGTSKLSGSLTLTLASTMNVTAVKINASQFGSDTGTLEVTAGETSLGSQTPDSDMSFEAESSVETNTITIETTKRAYIASISVMAEGGIGSVTYYTYYPNCTPTDVENEVIRAQKAQKMLMNGQMVIIRDGKMYNIMGNAIR